MSSYAPTLHRYLLQSISLPRGSFFLRVRGLRLTEKCPLDTLIFNLTEKGFLELIDRNYVSLPSKLRSHTAGVVGGAGGDVLVGDDAILQTQGSTALYCNIDDFSLIKF